MAEHRLEQRPAVPFYETFMTGREREIYKDFLGFSPDGKKTEGSVERKMDGGASERFTVRETDLERERVDSLEGGLALARELDMYQRQYMNPRLYTHRSDLNIGGPNCMIFAIDRPWMDSAGQIPYDIKPYPGYFCGEGEPCELYRMLKSGDFAGSKEKLESLLGADLETMGKNLMEVNGDYICRDGESLICIMGSSEYGDFHFMRKGENAWFHKPGLMSVSCFDDRGDFIVDPAHCDTIYDMFYGYYVIRNKGGGQ